MVRGLLWISRVRTRATSIPPARRRDGLHGSPHPVLPGDPRRTAVDDPSFGGQTPADRPRFGGGCRVNRRPIHGWTDRSRPPERAVQWSVRRTTDARMQIDTMAIGSRPLRPFQPYRTGGRFGPREAVNRHTIRLNPAINEWNRPFHYETARNSDLVLIPCHKWNPIEDQ